MSGQICKMSDQKKDLKEHTSSEKWKIIISSTDMEMLCQTQSQSEEHYKNLPLKERELIIDRLGHLLKLTSGNVEYSECLHEFLRGKVQKKALASRQAACKICTFFSEIPWMVQRPANLGKLINKKSNLNMVKSRKISYHKPHVYTLYGHNINN